MGMRREDARRMSAHTHIHTLFSTSEHTRTQQEKIKNKTTHTTHRDYTPEYLQSNHTALAQTQFMQFMPTESARIFAIYAQK